MTDAETLLAVVRESGGAEPLDLNRAFFIMRENHGWKIRRWNRAFVAALQAGLVTVYHDDHGDPWIVARADAPESTPVFVWDDDHGDPWITARKP